jgi:serpin B
MRISSLLRRATPVGLLLSFGVGPTPGAPAGQTQAFVQGNAAFALDLYSRLKDEAPNLFFSPYSISTCLAMAYGGARGDTAEQMAKVLHFNKDARQVHSSFGELQRQLNEAGAQKGIQLSVANALWAQQGHPFLPPFLNIARGEYRANLNQADFKTGAEPARAEINRWVAQQTHERIKDILPPGSVDSLTRLVLANAIYFKGTWAVPFPAAATRPLPFHLSATSEFQVPFMHHTDHVRYIEDKDMQAVELPYSGNELAMVVLLPRRIDGCGDLEARLTPALLSNSLAQMNEQKVEIFLPKFKLEYGSGLNEPLKEMGMRDTFGPKTDFSGMDGTKRLYISGVFHKAWVEVNEEGTEAAAATGVVMGVTSIAKPKVPPVFRADHPFIFLIRDTRSGSLLFLGRLAQPSA